MGTSLSTCLWFDNQALPAAQFYCELLPDSGITRVMHYPEGNPHAPEGADGVMLVAFRLAGVPYEALNGGPHFRLSEAVSISVLTDDQAETDRLWSALTEGDGAESQCGWCRDRFGLSWQIVPRRAIELLEGPAAAQAWAALMTMKKIDVAALEAAIRT